MCRAWLAVSNPTSPESGANLAQVRSKHILLDVIHNTQSKYVNSMVEVATFNKRIEECESFQDEFLFYMKNLPTFVEKPG